MKHTDELFAAALGGELGPDPATLTAISVFWIHHGTRLAGGDVTYLNQYVLVRLGGSFGGCAFEAGEIGPELCREVSGSPLDTLLREGRARCGSPPSTRISPSSDRTARLPTPSP